MSIFKGFKAAGKFLELVKFEHSIFALPFAYLGMVLAAGGWPGWRVFLLITIAMVAARTLAMSANRLADLTWDARNPRTRLRPLVTGAITTRTAWIGSLAAVLVLAAAAAMLGPLPLVLLPGALLALIGYSFTKRFTTLSHFILGFTDGLAPVGAWVAVKGSLFSVEDVPAWILLAVVTLWIGGFDLLYACQDVDFDRECNLYAIPARRGVSFALRLSSFCHAGMLLLLVWLGFWMHLTWFYWLALVVVTILLVWEHRLVKLDDLSRIDMAFFNINGYIAIVLFLGVIGGLFIK